MIAIGNGTASRESEMFVSDMIKETPREIHYVIVSEAGASVYSASKLATEEYPDINVSIRGAISIARRLQDPLAELVKIDPKAIGVGQYQPKKISRKPYRRSRRQCKQSRSRCKHSNTITIILCIRNKWNNSKKHCKI